MFVGISIHGYSFVYEINKSGFENWKCMDFDFMSFRVCVREGVRL